MTLGHEGPPDCRLTNAFSGYHLRRHGEWQHHDGHHKRVGLRERRGDDDAAVTLSRLIGRGSTLGSA